MIKHQPRTNEHGIHIHYLDGTATQKLEDLLHNVIESIEGPDRHYWFTKDKPLQKYFRTNTLPALYQFRTELEKFFDEYEKEEQRQYLEWKQSRKK